MQISSPSTLALAGALALGLTVAFAGIPDTAQARGGGGGATGGIEISLPTDRGTPPPRGGVITYTNEFPEEDPPIIIIPLPKFGRAAPGAPGYQVPCIQDRYRPNARILCERVSR